MGYKQIYSTQLKISLIYIETKLFFKGNKIYFVKSYYNRNLPNPCAEL